LFVVAYIAGKPELAWNWMIKPSQLFHCGSCVEQHSYCTVCYIIHLVTDLLTSYHACISSWYMGGWYTSSLPIFIKILFLSASPHRHWLPEVSLPKFIKRITVPVSPLS